jgi:hypothetical protein
MWRYIQLTVYADEGDDISVTGVFTADRVPRRWAEYEGEYSK